MWLAVLLACARAAIVCAGTGGLRMGAVREPHTTHGWRRTSLTVMREEADLCSMRESLRGGRCRVKEGIRD